ncbi:MAG: hypothetical protein JW750_06810 [Anaerolineaceae bacterium]|nr:hypothetical protein [Anaerolineaceae bacterium]
MASKNTKQFESKIIRLVHQLPFDETEKKAWLDELDREGMSEYLAKTISEKLTELERPEDEKDARKMQQNLMSLSMTIRQWRLTQNLNAINR